MGSFRHHWRVSFRCRNVSTVHWPLEKVYWKCCRIRSSLQAENCWRSALVEKMVRFGIWWNLELIHHVIEPICNSRSHDLTLLAQDSDKPFSMLFYNTENPSIWMLHNDFPSGKPAWSQRIRALKPASNVWGANPCPLSTTHSDGDRYCKDQWDSQRVQARKGMKGLVRMVLEDDFFAWLLDQVYTKYTIKKKKQLKTFHD